jgi:hypothetical protein
MASVEVFDWVSLAPVVGAALGVVAQLHDTGHVEHVVHPSVARPREPMPDLLAGRGVDRRGAGPGGEVVTVGEACHVHDVGQDPRRTDRADAVDVGASIRRGYLAS